jgi:hypothetical protein
MVVVVWQVDAWWRVVACFEDVRERVAKPWSGNRSVSGREAQDDIPGDILMDRLVGGLTPFICVLLWVFTET